MKNNLKISIIIPVYNSSKYLVECINSILNQTLKDIEIIAVENGSTDNSLDLLNKYKEQISIYHLKTPSISEARNKGIEKSKGEYLLFFDSDDYMESNMCEELYNKAIKDSLDIVTSDYYKCYEIGKIKEVFKTIDFENCNLNDNKDLIWKINYGPVKLFKKEIIKNNNIKFPNNIKYEDIPFVFQCIINSKKIGKVNKPLFTYVIHENSETNVRDERVFDIFKCLDMINQKYQEKEILINLNAKILTNYTIQQRYQKNKNIRNRFIEDSFNYLDNNFPNWRKCEYFVSRNKVKGLIEKNISLSKIYTWIYSK